MIVVQSSLLIIQLMRQFIAFPSDIVGYVQCMLTDWLAGAYESRVQIWVAGRARKFIGWHPA